jgi:hypothetical protein
MEKIFKQKNFNNFVWTPLVVELIYIQIFAFKFTLRWLQPDIFPKIGKFFTGVADTGGNFVDTSGKFAAGVVDTGGKFAIGVVDIGVAPWLANISAIFLKNLKWP